MLTSKVINILHIKLARFVIFHFFSKYTIDLQDFVVFVIDVNRIAKRTQTRNRWRARCRRCATQVDAIVANFMGWMGRRGRDIRGREWPRRRRRRQRRRNVTPPKMTVDRIECPIWKSGARFRVIAPAILSLISRADKQSHMRSEFRRHPLASRLFEFGCWLSRVWLTCAEILISRCSRSPPLSFSLFAFILASLLRGTPKIEKRSGPFLTVFAMIFML